MSYFNDIRVRFVFMRFVIFSVFEKDFVYVSVSVLKEFIRVVENDECYFIVIEYIEFIGFFY